MKLKEYEEERERDLLISSEESEEVKNGFSVNPIAVDSVFTERVIDEKIDFERRTVDESVEKGDELPTASVHNTQTGAIDAAVTVLVQEGDMDNLTNISITDPHVSNDESDISVDEIVLSADAILNISHIDVPKTAILHAGVAAPLENEPLDPKNTIHGTPGNPKNICDECVDSEKKAEELLKKQNELLDEINQRDRKIQLLGKGLKERDTLVAEGRKNIANLNLEKGKHDEELKNLKDKIKKF